VIDVVASIDALIEALSVPLSDADERAGWDDRLRKEWRTHFVNLREAVVAGKWPRAKRHHLMRWLNCESALDLGHSRNVSLRSSSNSGWTTRSLTKGRRARRHAGSSTNSAYPVSSGVAASGTPSPPNVRIEPA
jgi:hypothetical protein